MLQREDLTDRTTRSRPRDENCGIRAEIAEQDGASKVWFRVSGQWSVAVWNNVVSSVGNHRRELE